MKSIKHFLKDVCNIRCEKPALWCMSEEFSEHIDSNDSEDCFVLYRSVVFRFVLNHHGQYCNFIKYKELS